jgi:hypothetical protein
LLWVIGLILNRQTQFRRWATETLKQYIIKRFVLNDDMLKNGRLFGKDYFDAFLERIKEICVSELCAIVCDNACVDVYLPVF